MSSFAYDKYNNIVTIKNNSVSSGHIDDDYYCSSCRCKMHFVSESSNKRKAHFAGHHAEYCDIGCTTNTNNIYDYQMPDSLSNLLENIKHNKTQISQNSNNSNQKTSNKILKKKPLQTLRQLFNILASSDPSLMLYDNICVKDIYCGHSTSFLYTKYISDIHVVYAQFKRYDKERKLLYFNYPSIDKNNIEIKAVFQNSDDFNIFIKNHYKHIKRYFVIFSDFCDSYCELTSYKQIILT